MKKDNIIEIHNHDGLNSEKIKTYNVIPTYTMTPTELTRYLSRKATEGEEFNVYDGTNYRKYVYINSTWKYITLS